MSETQRGREIENHKRIFYTNITYGCNSSCIFCYSHNTKHSKYTYNEVSKDALIEYWDKMGINHKDRIIINGGEPLLHTEFNDIIEATREYGCEVLIYTNGRLLKELDVSKLTSNYRFVIPIHGHEALHDFITRVPGSYQEMMAGITHLSKSNALVDIKVIINNRMVENQSDYQKTVNSLQSLPELNAVHITKMADTIVSQRNNCPSVTSEMSSQVTSNLFDIFKEKCIVKLFDTCVKEIAMNQIIKVTGIVPKIQVYFKDAQHEFDVELEKPFLSCMNKCRYKDICQSAVGEYTVLELKDGSFAIGLE